MSQGPTPHSNDVLAAFSGWPQHYLALLSGFDRDPLQFSIDCRDPIRGHEFHLQRFCRAWILQDRQSSRRFGVAIEVFFDFPSCSSASCRRAIVMHHARQGEDTPALLMEYDTPADPAPAEGFFHCVAAISAVCSVTSGNEMWAVRHRKESDWSFQSIPFSLGRTGVAIATLDRVGQLSAPVVSVVTRGRAGHYRSKVLRQGEVQVGARRWFPCQDASHPQVPLLRKLVDDSLDGCLRLVGAEVVWPRSSPGTPMMRTCECTDDSGIRITDPVISFHVAQVH